VAAVKALSTVRNRTREVTVVAFYVSVTLAAELAAASSGDSKALLVASLWGTAIGLALAHWYAQTITAAIGRGAFHKGDAVEGLREVGAAAAVALVLTLPFILFATPTALVLSRWGVVIGTSLIALALARSAGAGWTRALTEAAIVFVIGVAVIETKAALSH
jgi:hypothetical protein